jgi:hypothetical protein
VIRFWPLDGLFERVLRARPPAGVYFVGRATLHVDHDVAGPLFVGLPDVLRRENNGDESNAVWAQGEAVLTQHGISWVPVNDLADAGVSSLRVPGSRIAGVDVDAARFFVFHVDEEASFALEVLRSTDFKSAVRQAHTVHSSVDAETAMLDEEASLWDSSVTAREAALPVRMVANWHRMLMVGWAVVVLWTFGPYAATAKSGAPSWGEWMLTVTLLLGAASIALTVRRSRQAPLVSLAGAIAGISVGFARVTDVAVTISAVVLFVVLALVSLLARVAEHEWRDFGIGTA